MLRAVILSEGRAAIGGRAELFTPGAIVWPAEGIAIRIEHRGAEVGRAVPERVGTEIRITAKATPAIFAAVEQRRQRYASVEFHALAETRTAGGVREIQRALVDGFSLTDDPEYETRAEIRKAWRRSRVWL